MRRDFLKGIAVCLVAGATLATAGNAWAEDASAFYKGKVINWIVPYNPGGGYDEYSRAIAPYMEKYTGARVDIENMPGAGGMKGANEIFDAPADGLTVGIMNGSAMVTNQLSGIEGARYKIGEFSYLGRMVADLRVLVVGTSSPYKTFDDVVASKQPVLLGATGLGGSTYVDAVITGPAFGIDQKVVHGFNNSSDVRQAMLRGDIQGMWGSLGSAIQGVEDGEHVIVLQSPKKRSAQLPDVPSVFEKAAALPNAEAVMPVLDAWDALNAVGRPVAGPPGIPEDRLAFLRDAFQKAMTDPEFVKLMADTERDLDYASGADMEQIAKAATDLAPDVHDKIVAAIRGDI
ncbi:TRAP transporter solute receptor, TAXI family [Hartmannibacter diazotrophicus]|uniref:TRAP transporter solute receptor, TAXI family n=1 Tax=Hartmannibacter diazotrophicus TaxID=1482074 RepID=A0A2C9DBT8_9HYPH|nr:tripartite tricarboxylate transporter substrate binding protein [Hartmannibacter diazotrophicus]SON57767.1 TRAP transporter solute receptor, TAXI family [Hartmannibacter diazotrophicus]